MRDIVSPLSGIRSPFGERRTAFSPAALFALAEPGVWYDPSDLTTLFQDTAGTTPVTTPGQSVALALDKSKGLVRSAEMISNGTFDSATNWTLSSGVTIAGGICTFSGVTHDTGLIQNSTAIGGGTGFIAGRTYEVEFTISNYTSGQIYLVWPFATSAFTPTNRTYRFIGVATDSRFSLRSFLSSVSLNIDNISVKELPGFHATQATAGSRPIYGIVPVGGRRNLLTFTEQFDNAVWTKSATTVTANAATAPDSTTTADFLVETATNAVHFVTQAFTYVSGTTYMHSVYAKSSDRTLQIVLTATSSVFTNAYANYNLQLGTVSASSGATATIQDVGNGWYRCNVFATALASASATIAFAVQNSPTAARSASYTGDGTSGILIWGAQLETGSTATAYQRVVSQYDVTEAGVSSLSYLAFDGVDDSLVTPSVNFSTDKMTVFAGVRKLSDAAAGLVVESSAAVVSNAGAFALFAPQSTSSATYLWRTRGSAAQVDAGTAGVYAAPITNVLTGIGDISGDVATLRVNGTQAATSATDQGTGNYLAYPLYIGRRGGTSIPFNGQLYSLIVRNAATSADQLTASEKWVAGKTGVTL